MSTPRQFEQVSKLDAAPPEHELMATRSTLDEHTVRQLVEENYDFIWRLLARLNVPSDEVDDATQQVFMLLVTKDQLEIVPGRERSFLFGVALRTAQEFRRRASIRNARLGKSAETLADSQAGTEALASQLQARRLLDQILSTLPEQMRVVFVLHEIEGMSAREISELTETPPGTVASRLRRARQLFQEQVQRLQHPETQAGSP